MSDETDDDALFDDAGGVPFDDEFDDEGDDQSDTAGERGGSAGYDSGKKLIARGIEYPATTPIGMKRLKSFTIGTWGGSDLGILSNPPRNFRGGSSPSLHNWGMAWDWRWANPGPGRATADTVIEFLIDRSKELGIQAIHDYEGGRYWKSYRGWKPGTSSASTGMGQSWAQWLHIERTWASANDKRTIATALSEGGASAETPTVTPSGGGTEKMEVPDPQILLGDSGANVARLQDFLRHYGFATFTRSDGIFGPRTKLAVEVAQRHCADNGWYSGKIDGEYGPKSAAAAAKLVTARAAGDTPSID